MTTKIIQTIGRTALQTCRERGWAAMESGISWPIPILHSNEQVRLGYLLYWSQLRGRQQIVHEPFARITVTYPQGQIQEHHRFQISSPPREIGRFPYPGIAQFTPDERRALWNEMFDAYPGAIAAYASWPAAARPAELGRFAEIMQVTIPPFLYAAYHALNPDFFQWMERISQ